EEAWDYLPYTIRSRQPLPDWLTNIRKSVHCRLIETQRLMTFQKREDQYERDDAIIPTVSTYSSDLSEATARTLAESATFSQSLDRTFPNRLLTEESGSPPSERKLRERLDELEARRTKLTKAGLLDQTQDSALIPQKAFTDQQRRILAEYVEDARKKLDVFSD